MSLKSFTPLFTAAVLCLLTGFSHATIVQIDTSAGVIEVNLYDDTTPETVANFLSYVSDGSYNDGFFHRSIPSFIVQGGGYYFTDTNDVDSVQPIASKGNVVNEPVYSNVMGTIAMAKIACSPNSATSEWFINLADNSANLDTQNAGFTVFGQVISGMEFMDAIANSKGTSEDFVAISSISILDGVPDTSEQFVSERPLNTLINGADNTGCDASGSSGGSFHWGSLLLLMLVGVKRTKYSPKVN